ncbi:MAG: hypothetical protein ACE14S_00565 [Candidatus Bathyarchaeia archaeon]
MSEVEDAVATVARLLRTNLRVVKDDGGLANIVVTTEWQNAEAFGNCDGQVTVGLVESADLKLELSGRKRRRLSALRVTAWTTDQPSAADSGRAMRSKVVEEINRVLRQKHARPNETRYSLWNTGPPSQTHKAFSGEAEASPYAPGWAELSAEDYVKLWYSDDDRCQVVSEEDEKRAVLLFRLKTESREKTAKKLVLSFEGYGTAPDVDGVTLKVWNHELAAWTNAQSGGDGGVDEAIVITVDQGLGDYIDEDGYVWLLAVTSGSSDGETPAVLRCNYASLTVTVNGVSYCDIASYRDLDRVDVKPFIYRTEFTVRSWFFENIVGE